MNQLFAGGLAFLLAIVLWGTNKKKMPIIFYKQNNSTYNNLPNSSLVKQNDLEADSKKSLKSSNSIHWQKLPSPLDQLNLRKKLFKLMSDGPDERLQAVKIASKLCDGSSLPILRRGLNDFDIRVVEEAAKGIEQKKYSKRSIRRNTQTKSSPSLPRNIFLMR